MSIDTVAVAESAVAGPAGTAAVPSGREATGSKAPGAEASAGSAAAPATRSRRARSIASSVFYKLIGWVAFLAIWWAVTEFGIVKTIYLSSPQTVAATLVDLFVSGAIWPQLLPSLARALSGFLLATVVGVVLGVALGWFKLFERIVDPVLQFFRQLSAFALFPVFLLFFGIGESSKIAIIFWSAFWPILLTTIAAVKDVEILQINAAKTLGASRWYVFSRVVFPASLPQIFPGIRLGGAYSITALVAAEMIGAPSGLGIFVLTSQQVFHTPAMYAGIVVLGLLGLAVNYLLLIVEKRATRWQKGITNG